MGYKAYLADIDEFKSDPQNANRHTSRGIEAVKESMNKRGYARPAFAASDGTVLGGNLSTLEVATNLEVGNGKVLVVETDGQLPIIHKRIDIQPGTKEAHLLAIEDNRTAELSLDWDAQIMVSFMQDGLDLTELWNPDELSMMLEGAADSLLPTDPANDPNAEWRGMPGFENENAFGAVLTLKVHFANEGDVREFASLIKQSVTVDTQYIWYPKQKREELLKFRAIDES